MKEKMFKNLSLKILSAIFAVVLWTVIVNVYDPTTSYTFSNVSVQQRESIIPLTVQSDMRQQSLY